MAIPSKVQGAGNNSNARNVFRITFSQALSASPQLEAWDDSTFSTFTKEMFVGTAVNGSIPFLSAVATTDVTPSVNWKPASPVFGGAVANRMEGSTNFVILSALAPGVGGTVRFNLVWEIPRDASVPSTNTLNGVIATRFSFSGSTPTLTWQFNDNSAGGTEGVPVWTTITPGAAGNFIRPANLGATSASVVMTKPQVGVADSPEVWVTST